MIRRIENLTGINVVDYLKTAMCHERIFERIQELHPTLINEIEKEQETIINSLTDEEIKQIWNISLKNRLRHETVLREPIIPILKIIDQLKKPPIKLNVDFYTTFPNILIEDEKA